jgi:hypothetical protein
MSHVVLLGDSIFDNASYVPGEPPVVDQLRGELPRGWKATLLAVDGNVTADVPGQLGRLPPDATHLVVSVGGNDALSASSLLNQPVRSVAEGLFRLTEVQSDFRSDYQAMLEAARAAGLPVAVCTVYDSIPGMERVALTGLCLFNDCIVHEAARAGVPVLDLRLVCTDAADYSPVSPIEPSARGGAKIARAIAALLRRHDFASRRTVVYGGVD